MTAGGYYYEQVAKRIANFLTCAVPGVDIWSGKVTVAAF